MYRQIIAKRLMLGWKLGDEVASGAGEAKFCSWFYAGDFLMPEVKKLILTPANQLLGGLMDVYLTGFDGIATAQGKVFFIARHCWAIII